MTRLFIEGKEIDLDENVQFAITKQFEELSDPTIICNDWSKTVSIPFTNRNDEIFGHIYNPDKVIVASNNSLTGIYFDPLKKLDFRLEYDGNVLMTGYAKMNQIKQSKGRGSYEITLFGMLGKVLQEMSKITFDKNFPETDYIIEGEKYVSETYNKDLIYDSWTSPGQEHTQLYTKDSANYNVTDIIGFAPNNSFDNGFDYTCYQVYDNTAQSFVAKKFTDVLESANFEDTTGISPDTIIPDGLMPREIGEYRSYLQLPFIYWNKLFQIFQQKAEEVTGYTFDLDEWWFNVDNPYWHDLVYMLQKVNFDSKNTDYSIKNQYTPNGDYITKKIGKKWKTFTSKEDGCDPIFDSVITVGEQNGGYGSMDINPYTTHIDFPLADVFEQEQFILDSKNFYIPEKFATSNIPLELKLNFSLYYSHCAMIFFFIPLSYGALYGDNALNIKLYFKDDEDNVLKTISMLMLCANYSASYNPNDYDKVIPFNDINYYEKSIQTPDGPGDSRSYWLSSFNDFEVNVYTTINELAGKKFHIDAETQWATQNFPAAAMHIDPFIPRLILYNNKNRYLKTNITAITRSNSYFSMNDLWNNDVNLFNEIIRYCKMYRLSIIVDDLNKTISFKPLFKFFENYKISDWTNIIDKSKDFNIKPIAFEDKYVVLNNDSNGTKISNDYKDAVGLSYGSYRIITDYNFNNNTKELFKGNKESITNTDYILSWTNIHDNKRVIYSYPNEIYVYNKDNDNKFVSNFGSFYFHRGIKDFNTEPELALRPVIITDDTNYMQFNKTYFYTQFSDQNNYKYVTTYPFLDIIKDDVLCSFGAPLKSYTYSAEYSYKNGIYTNLWEKYVNERYNVQNKVLTCYVNLKPSDFLNFSFNKFVKIDNQIYIVNKIYDYDITSNQLTKVDLVKVQDINAYKSINYQYDYIHLNPTSLLIPYDHYRKIIVDATRNWEIDPSDDWRDYLAVSQNSGSKGLTTVYIGSTDENWISNLQFDLLNDVPETIKTATLNIGFGGIESISISQFYTELEQGASATFTVTSSKSWHLDWTNKNNGSADITFSPTSGQAGTTTVTVTASDYGYGMSDFYLENNDGDIVMKRVYVPQPYVSFSEPAVQLAPGESTTIIVYNRAISSWRVASQTGNASVTLNPTTGPASSGQVDSETQMTITAGNNTGTNIYTFDTTGQPGQNVAKLIVVVEDLPDSEEPDE